MIKFYRYFVSICKWLKNEWKREILCLILTCGIFAILLFNRALEDTLRISGMVYQILGLGTIVYDLYGAAKLFEITGYLERKIKTFPKFTPTSITINIPPIDIVLNASVGSVSIIQEPSTIEEKLNAFKKEVDDKLKVMREDIYQEFNRHHKIIQKERLDRIQADKDNKDLIKSVTTDNVFWSFAGILWIFLGIIFSSIPKEITYLLN